MKYGRARRNARAYDLRPGAGSEGAIVWDEAAFEGACKSLPRVPSTLVVTPRLGCQKLSSHPLTTR
jgi:hypothetical protein